MAQSAGAHIRGLYRYPVKGLSPEAMAQIALGTGETVPFDRAYAIENGPGRFDPEHPQHLPKINFLMLMRDERLATLKTQFDDTTHTLTILRDNKQVARGQLSTPLGRKMIEQFLAAYMQAELRGAPKIVFAEGHSFSDVAAKCLHIVNLETLHELERAMGTPLNPLRFRPNLVIEGLGAWEEFKWIGKKIAVGDAELRVISRTQRCAATDVDPDTGKRDTAIPAVLQRTWGHTDFGVYAHVARGGTIAVGDTVATPD
ncbi:MAG TPA: MOSC domain-containing protein [Hyphomicrobium sp.]